MIMTVIKNEHNCIQDKSISAFSSLQMSKAVGADWVLLHIDWLHDGPVLI